MSRPKLTVIEGGKGAVDPAPAPRSHVTKATRKTQGAEQLALPFGDRSAAGAPPLKIIFVVMEEVFGRKLVDTILSERPNVVLDLRVSVSFNIPGISRQYILDLLNSIHSFYSIESIPWHNIDPSPLVADDRISSARLHHELLQRNPGTVMLFVPERSHAAILQAHLNRLLSGSQGREWESSVVAR